MSASRYKQLTRKIAITAASVTGTGPYAYTFTSASHGLVSGDVVTIVPQDVMDKFDVTLDGTTTGSVIGFSLTTNVPVNADSYVIVKYYKTGTTGGQTPFTMPLQYGGKAILQSYVVGTGGATFDIEGTIDGAIWTKVGSTVTNTAVNMNTQTVFITEPWLQFRINISVIGAATKLYVQGATHG